MDYELVIMGNGTERAQIKGATQKFVFVAVAAKSKAECGADGRGKGMRMGIGRAV